MDMGTLKPFEANRSAATVTPVESASARTTGQKELAGALAAGAAIASQTEDAVAQLAEIDPAALQSAVSDIQNFVQSVRRDINFQLDDDSGRVVVNVTESGSGNVIRQIPSEEALRLAENLSDIRSLLFEAEA